MLYNHHFMLSPVAHDYLFLPGDYSLEIIAEVVGLKPQTIFRTGLNAPSAEGPGELVVCFDWQSERQKYNSYWDLG